MFLAIKRSDFQLSFCALSVRTMSGQIIQKLSQANAKTIGERSGSVVECLSRDRGVAYSSITGVTALCLEQDIVINPSLKKSIIHSFHLVLLPMSQT